MGVYKGPQSITPMGGTMYMCYGACAYVRMCTCVYVYNCILVNKPNGHGVCNERIERFKIAMQNVNCHETMNELNDLCSTPLKRYKI